LDCLSFFALIVFVMSQAIASAAFSPAAFEAHLASQNEPAWLRERRQASHTVFEEMPMPGIGDEEWMRTDIRLFHLDRYCPSAESPSEPIAEPLLSRGVELGGDMVRADGHLLTSSLAKKWASQGVLYGSLRVLVAEHGDLLRPFFERQVVDARYDRFAALSDAWWSGGTLLYVPKGVVIDEPLHMISAMSDGGADLGRTLVVLEDGAEATLLAETASPNEDAGGMHCGTVELIVGDNAFLRYVNLQNWGSKAWHFSHQKAVIGRDARIQWTIGALGSRVAKVNQHVALAGEGAYAQVNGVMFTEGKQHLSYHTLQHHQAPHCRSDLLYNGGLQDKSRIVWRGMIKVDTEAQLTNGFQRNDSLMLDPGARSDSIPGLEIKADDVRCTHGSTAGRVDEEMIFYARCRGYTRQEAIRTIVAGFFQQVYDRITIPSVREALGQAVGQRIREYE
jgi:Fe-S cluster assembly protein SufD